MITDEDKERVRQATDVLALVGETVELRQRGNSFWGCCPFHQEKSPSFHVDPQTGLWKCFGCGESGDIFAYVMKRESLEFPDAIRYLADRAGIELRAGLLVEVTGFFTAYVPKGRMNFSVRTLKLAGEGKVEYKLRRDSELEVLTAEEAIAKAKALVDEEGDGRYMFKSLSEETMKSH